jgi:hypothetical protein
VQRPLRGAGDRLEPRSGLPLRGSRKASTVQAPIYAVFISGPAPRNFETSTWGYKTYYIGNMNAGHWPSMARPPRTADRRTGPPEASGFDPSNLKPAVGTRQTNILTVSARSRHWLIARKRAFAAQLFVYGDCPKPTVLRAAGTGGCGLCLSARERTSYACPWRTENSEVIRHMPGNDGSSFNWCWNTSPCLSGHRKNLQGSLVAVQP